MKASKAETGLQLVNNTVRNLSDEHTSQLCLHLDSKMRYQSDTVLSKVS